MYVQQYQKDFGTEEDMENTCVSLRILLPEYYIIILDLFTCEVMPFYKCGTAACWQITPGCFYTAYHNCMSNQNDPDRLLQLQT